MSDFQPEIIRETVFAIGVCVPEKWSEEEIVAFVNARVPCGMSCGWQLRKDGDSTLMGTPGRVACNERPGFVHVIVGV